MSDYITLEQMLEFREKKAQMQDNLRLRHSGTITVALGMNIPGPKKTDEEIVKAFREGCRELNEVLELAGLTVIEKVILEEAAGNVGFFSVTEMSGYDWKQLGLERIGDACDHGHKDHECMDTGGEDFWISDCEEFEIDGLELELAEIVKKITVDLEENHPLGRLFDIDVYDADGAAVSRQELGVPGRKCLICHEDAKACGRSRTHSVEELQRRVYEIIRSWAGTV